MNDAKRYYAYTVTRISTGLVRYIGITTRSITTRWSEHNRQKVCARLRRAIDKYGRDAFEISCIASAWDEASATDLEAILIRQYRTLTPHGYNLTTGGEGGFRMSAETRERMSLAKKGKAPLAALAALRARDWVPKMEKMKRKPLSSEHRAKLSLAGKGRPHTLEHRAKLSAARTGKTHSVQTKAKLSARIITPETRANISASHTAERRAEFGARVAARHAAKRTERLLQMQVQ